MTSMPLLKSVGRCVFGSLCLALLPPLSAQSTADSGATGTVTGVITCGDTQRPARFAKVTLTPVKPSTPDFGKLSEKDAKDNPAAALKLMGALMGSVTMLSAQTGLDGSYTLADVAPGDYYVSPSAPGYVSALAQAELAGPDATGAKNMSGVLKVHVEANHTARADATMERGAALNGMVLYDDGSPASGVTVQFENVNAARKKAAKKDDEDLGDFSAMMSLAMSGGVVVATTDDRGHFRLAGLAAGDYTVQATVNLGAALSMRAGVMDVNRMKPPSPLKFYAPGTLYRKDASVITVKSGEDRGDIEIRVDLSGMKSVSGRVASAVDHHALNSATITLTDTTDKEVKRKGYVDENGAFTVSFVPPGTYTLEVSDAADKEAIKPKAGAPALVRFNTMRTVKSYENASQPLIVAASDVTGISIELKESAKAKQDVDLNGLFGGSAGKSKE